MYFDFPEVGMLRVQQEVFLLRNNDAGYCQNGRLAGLHPFITDLLNGWRRGFHAPVFRKRRFGKFPQKRSIKFERKTTIELNLPGSINVHSHLQGGQSFVLARVDYCHAWRIPPASKPSGSLALKRRLRLVCRDNTPPDSRQE